MDFRHRNYILVATLFGGFFITPSREQECAVDHDCKGFGLELLISNTGEAAFCKGPGSNPICPGIDITGNKFTASVSVSSTRATSTNVPTSTNFEATGITDDPSSEPTIFKTSSEATTTSPNSASEFTSTFTSIIPEASTDTASINSVWNATVTSASPEPTAVSTSEHPDSSNMVSETVTTIRPSTTPKSCERLSCRDKKEGIIYAYPECNCRKFFICIDTGTQRGLVYHQYRCVGTAVFDANRNICTSDRTACPY